MTASEFLHQTPKVQPKDIESQFLLKVLQDSFLQLSPGGSFPTLEQYFRILYTSVK